jgi:UDP-N-acetylmuramoyl-L-alanyl-D-glutamate--2,6-diaminopimelate ligase
MTVQELLKGIGIKRKEGDLDAEIKGIAYDSRLIEKGFLFVAIKGFSADGHDYINDAISRGAVAMVTEKAVDAQITDRPVNRDRLAYVVTEDSRKALALLSAAFYGRPSDSLPLIGITGTNGKTTTSYITKNILQAWGKNVGLLGTINYIVGDRTLKALNTTPESLDLQRYLRDMIDGGLDYSVLEVSSHALALNRVEGCSFKVAAFTNFSQDHLDFHGTMQEYFRTKSKLFSLLGRDGRAVLNWDDPMVRSLSEGLNRDVVTCGFEEGAIVKVEGITQHTDRGGLTIELRTPKGRFTVESPLEGRFNAYNILMSAGIAYALDIRAEVIQKGVRDTKNVNGRFEKIEEGQKFLCIVDYAHTEDALRKLIQEARLITDGKIITVFGCGGDRDSSKRPLMGAVASGLSDFAIITSDNPRTEDPMKIIREIVQGMENNNYSLQPDRSEAIKEAVVRAGNGDTLIVAGKGHEDYQEIKGVRFRFSDKDVLRKALRSRKGFQDSGGQGCR